MMGNVGTLKYQSNEVVEAAHYHKVGRIANEHITLIHLGQWDLIPEYETEV